MLDPGAYVVVGFGKKGSNDTESPMPKVDAAPIQLNDVEIDTIIAFLQSKDGNDVTVELPTDAPALPDESTVPAAPAVAATAEDALNKYTCTACHAILESQSPVGPNLNDVGGRLSANQIRESSTQPSTVIAEGFPTIRPPTIAEKMTVKEFEMVVNYLAKQKAK